MDSPTATPPPAVRPSRGRPRAPLSYRALVAALTGLLTLLFVWLLGFVLRDVDLMRGPDYRDYETRIVGEEALAEERRLAEESLELAEDFADGERRRAALRVAASDAQETMNQVLHNGERLRAEGSEPSEAERLAFEESQAAFLSRQSELRDASDRLDELQTRIDDARDRSEAHREKTDELRGRARDEHARDARAHRMRVAALKLAIVLPLLFAAAWTTRRAARSRFAPIAFAALAACAWKTLGVVHEYFPAPLFKYLAVAAAIAATLAFLVRAIQSISAPRPAWMLKRSREAYDRGVCAICSFPVRRGSLRNLGAILGRKGTIVVAPADAAEPPDEPYVCPSCGTALFEKCAACGSIRHSLLPFCESCGAANEDRETSPPAPAPEPSA